MKATTRSTLLFLLLILSSISLFAQQNGTVMRTHYHVPRINNPSDTAWRAIFTYDLRTVTYTMHNEQEYYGDDVVVSNCKIHSETGNIKTLLALLEFESPLGTHDLYNANKYNVYKPYNKFTDKEKDSILFPLKSGDTVEYTNRKPTDPVFAGLILVQQWLYNITAQKIIVTIPSAAMYTKRYSVEDPKQPFYYLDAAIKFSARYDDTLDITQPLYKPEIVWAKLFNTVKLWANDSASSITDTMSSVALKSMAITRYSFPCSKIEDLLFEAVKSQKIKAYKYTKNNYHPGSELKKKQLDSVLTKYVSVQDSSAGPPVPCPIESWDICGIRVVQEMLYNQGTSKFESRIIRAALLRHELDINGSEITGEPVPLLWIKFEN